MTRGKTTDNETIYKIMLSMFHTNNFSETSRNLNIPVKTVEKIFKENKDKDEFTKLCNEKKAEFADKASEIIGLALERLRDSIENKQENIPVNHLTTVIGTLYDKRALAKGEATVNENVTIKVTLLDD